MRKKNAGFMLVEVIITSTVILTALIAFYSEFNKLYSKYNERINYHDVNSLFATKEIFNYLSTNDNFDFNNYINYTFYNDKYSYIIKNQQIDLSIKCAAADLICNNVNNKNSNQNNIDNILYIKNLYKIKNLIFSEYDKNALAVGNNSLKSQVDNATFKDYIDYIVNYYDINMPGVYNYIILTEIEEGNNTYYSSLRIR